MTKKIISLLFLFLFSFLVFGPVYSMDGDPTSCKKIISEKLLKVVEKIDWKIKEMISFCENNLQVFSGSQGRARSRSIGCFKDLKKEKLILQRKRSKSFCEKFLEEGRKRYLLMYAEKIKNDFNILFQFISATDWCEEAKLTFKKSKEEIEKLLVGVSRAKNQKGAIDLLIRVLRYKNILINACKQNNFSCESVDEVEHGTDFSREIQEIKKAVEKVKETIYSIENQTVIEGFVSEKMKTSEIKKIRELSSELENLRGTYLGYRKLFLDVKEFSELVKIFDKYCSNEESNEKSIFKTFDNFSTKISSRTQNKKRSILWRLIIFDWSIFEDDALDYLSQLKNELNELEKNILYLPPRLSMPLFNDEFTKISDRGFREEISKILMAPRIGDGWIRTNFPNVFLKEFWRASANDWFKYEKVSYPFLVAFGVLLNNKIEFLNYFIDKEKYELINSLTRKIENVGSSVGDVVRVVNSLLMNKTVKPIIDLFMGIAQNKPEVIINWIKSIDASFTKKCNQSMSYSPEKLSAKVSLAFDANLEKILTNMEKYFKSGSEKVKKKGEKIKKFVENSREQLLKVAKFWRYFEHLSYVISEKRLISVGIWILENHRLIPERLLSKKGKKTLHKAIEEFEKLKNNKNISTATAGDISKYSFEAINKIGLRDLVSVFMDLVYKHPDVLEDLFIKVDDFAVENLNKLFEIICTQIKVFSKASEDRQWHEAIKAMSIDEQKTVLDGVVKKNSELKFYDHKIYNSVIVEKLCSRGNTVAVDYSNLDYIVDEVIMKNNENDVKIFLENYFKKTNIINGHNTELQSEVIEKILEIWKNWGHNIGRKRTIIEGNGETNEQIENVIHRVFVAKIKKFIEYKKIAFEDEKDDVAEILKKKKEEKEDECKNIKSELEKLETTKAKLINRKTMYFLLSPIIALIAKLGVDFFGYERKSLFSTTKISAPKKEGNSSLLKNKKTTYFLLSLTMRLTEKLGMNFFDCGRKPLFSTMKVSTTKNEGNFSSLLKTLIKPISTKFFIGASFAAIFSFAVKCSQILSIRKREKLLKTKCTKLKEEIKFYNPDYRNSSGNSNKLSSKFIQAKSNEDFLSELQYKLLKTYTQVVIPMGVGNNLMIT